MFQGMLESLKEETVGFLFNLQVEQAGDQSQAATPAAAETPVTASGQDGAQQQGRSQQGSGRHARAAPPQPSTDSSSSAPAALQGKGLDGATPQALTYSGPAEDGGVESRGNGTSAQKKSGSGGSRRERRAAAREEAKKNKKSAKK